MRLALQPLRDWQQFGLPALKCLVAACLPYTLFRTAATSCPDFFRGHPTQRLLALYGAHTWGVFFLIMAGVILFLGLTHGRPARSTLRT